MCCSILHPECLLLKNPDSCADSVWPMPKYPDIQPETTDYKQFWQMELRAFVPETYIFPVAYKSCIY